MKLYRVSVDIRWTDDYGIRAKSKAQARQKAIDKFRSKRSNFKADVEDDD